MKKIKHKVSYVLNNYPETRNSDWKVAFKVWEFLGVKFTPEEQMKIMKAHKLGSFYTIERQCRKVRAEEGLKGTEEVEKKRFENEMKYKNDALDKSPMWDWLNK